MTKETFPEINYAVTKIEQLSESNVILGEASGFIFKDEKGIKYLITNKHVVINKKKLKFPQKLNIKLHKSKENHKFNQNITISLYEEEKPLWLEHTNSIVDVVLIPLNNTTLKDSNLYFFNSSIINNFSKENFLIDISLSSFGNVLVVGYPLGFHDTTNNLPIYRKGMIASTYGVNFEDNPFFLIDANLHSGSSGSPVLSHPSNLLKTEKGNIHSDGNFLLGIHSAERWYEDREDESIKKPLGLCAVWYIENIIEIINSN